MKHVFIVGGKVIDIVLEVMRESEGDDSAQGPVPISERFHPDFLSSMEQIVEVNEKTAVHIGDVYDGKKFGAPAAPAAPEPTVEESRAERDRLLAATDWSQLADVPAETQETWRKYRQQLRDVPAQSGFPAKVKWPKAPA